MAKAQDRFIFLNVAPTTPPPTGITYVYTDANGVLKSMDSAGNVEKYVGQEIGTFSPTLSTDGTDFDSVTYHSAVGGKYIKTGQLCHINIYMRTDGVTIGSASGNIVIGNLPFTVEARNLGANGSSPMTCYSSDGGGWVTNNPSKASASDGTNYIRLYYKTSSDSQVSSMTVSHVDTATSGVNHVTIAGTYITV